MLFTEPDYFILSSLEHVSVVSVSMLIPFKMKCFIYLFIWSIPATTRYATRQTRCIIWERTQAWLQLDLYVLRSSIIHSIHLEQDAPFIMFVRQCVMEGVQISCPAEHLVFTTVNLFRFSPQALFRLRYSMCESEYRLCLCLLALGVIAEMPGCGGGCW